MVSAALLAEQGAKVVGIADWKGGVYNDSGLDITALLEHVKTHKTVAGFAKADPLDPAKLFGLDVDVLVPAALENQITADNAGQVRAMNAISSSRMRQRRCHA